MPLQMNDIYLWGNIDILLSGGYVCAWCIKR